MSSSLGTEFYSYDDFLHNNIYRLAPPRRKRDRPMKVLCLGLSRSGTDSLRHALTILGYSNVYHGWTVTGGQREDCIFWIPYLKAKFADSSYDKAKYLPGMAKAEVFDQVLGDCQATTDVPTNLFGKELMKAYPEAKIILNKRRDLDKWHTSMKQTYMPIFGAFFTVIRWFDTSIFWLYRCFGLCVYPWANWDFDAYGKDAAAFHYADLESHMKQEGKEWLEWNVEDGWEPLCKFLGKDVPKEPFPNLNAGVDGFQKNVNKRVEADVIHALSRMAAIFGIVLAGTFAAVWSSRK